ncbi:hypothetical protein PHABIO_111 [Pseudomonas phage Phabio]|uniref:Uncharacterized protein n=1 Tax=Pseudomonas phage Phabio TaxID=2006668 RepID=A0A1Y0STE8_9CAUD|nr:hypothetical protein MZD05_gp111 [Pseudomonas phage Phabio]ARV76742.1 hypothetical protein PHABIO_111 [Pseudomonas phage Phabio]
MSIDVFELTAKASRLSMSKPNQSSTFNKERHEEAMKVAAAPRDPKYWYQANEISKNIISEVGV